MRLLVVVVLVGGAIKLNVSSRESLSKMSYPKGHISLSFTIYFQNCNNCNIDISEKQNETIKCYPNVNYSGL